MRRGDRATCRGGRTDVKVAVKYDPDLGYPRVTLEAETEAEREDLELVAAFEDVRFSYVIDCVEE